MVTEVSAKDLSLLLNLSERRIHQLVNQDIITRNDNNKFLVCEAIEQYYKFKFDVGTAESLKKEQAKHEEIKCKLSQYKLKVIEKELISLDEVEKAMISVISNAKSKLLGLSSKVAPRIISENNINIIREEIDAEIKDALEELSNYKFEDIEEEVDKYE